MAFEKFLGSLGVDSVGALLRVLCFMRFSFLWNSLSMTIFLSFLSFDILNSVIGLYYFYFDLIKFIKLNSKL